MTQIQLTVEEALSYQKYEAYLDGYADAVRATTEHLKKKRVEEIAKAKTAAPPAPPPEPQA